MAEEREVVVGNYRTSLAGVDLNRRWSNPSAVRRRQRSEASPAEFHLLLNPT